MQERKSPTHTKWWIFVSLLCVVFVAGTYIVRLGSTDDWPETNCVFAGSRVVRDVVPPAPVRSHVIVLYRGEYRLRYTVEDRDYFVWASSGWADPDQRFVEAKMDYTPEHCNFRIRYNPAHPSEAFAVRDAPP